MCGSYLYSDLIFKRALIIEFNSTANLKHAPIVSKPRYKSMKLSSEDSIELLKFSSEDSKLP